MSPQLLARKAPQLTLICLDTIKRKTMYNSLTDEQIETALEELNVAWSAIPGQGLVRVFDTKNFSEGLELVNQIASIAEALNHHPDIRLGYREVEVTSITHSTGSLTAHDVELAKAIDRIFNK